MARQKKSELVKLTGHVGARFAPEFVFCIEFQVGRGTPTELRPETEKIAFEKLKITRRVLADESVRLDANPFRKILTHVPRQIMRRSPGNERNSSEKTACVGLV